MDQEEDAVLAAIQRVRETTGYGRVIIEIKDDHVRLIEISSTILIKRSDKIEEKCAHKV